ncbi:hypothetical protein CYMTET_8820 [Cymbomonas tetramitiformis]|uniref:HAT C-terminal dimerisation domain-containing protein n=1 Tax=Cymbomonas tetramitiformis TaxID=36881 RepID=A0AAE0GSV3_9CHLO|nr:hypothetical protein CYMTET_8820 [Cymbomonas tetramitiformis]
MFGILVYWLDKNFHYHERLLAALPFSSVRHTAIELEKATKVACADVGLGECNDSEDFMLDTVRDFVHATCSDNASNIVSGWETFDGHECCDHTIALIVLTFLEQPNVKKVAVQMYDVEFPSKAGNAAPNPDGSVYRQHQLAIYDWDIVREAMYVLRYMKEGVDLLRVESWAKNIVTKDWKPTPAVQEEEQRDAKRRKRNNDGGCALESFLLDSDSEDEGETVEVVVVPEEERDELQQYLCLPDAKPDVDVLEWWRKHSVTFPSLARMARQFLGVPASTAGVERAFSSVNFMHSDLRKSLEEGTIQHTLMAAMN